jgi:LysR family glycine cleavage system transcriptional activator
MALSLPPLNALRAFEAAVRTGSYVAAAAELGVSPAAISQQIRKLEDHLGKDLFTRLNNRVVLTDAGQALAGGAAAGLQMIADAAGQLAADRSRARLGISCIESVAEKWLLPRLAAYARQHPDLRFDLRVEGDPVDFSRHAIDLRLGYDGAHYPGQQVVALARDVVVPLCSPDFRARRGDDMAALASEDLLHTDWGPTFGSHPSWPLWFAQAGLPMPQGRRGFAAGASALVLDLARQGLGVALGQRMLARDDLAAGSLVALSEVSLPLGHAYCLAFPPAKAQKRHLAGLVDWLSTGAD